MPSFAPRMPSKSSCSWAKKWRVKTPEQVDKKPRQKMPRLRKEEPSSMASKRPPIGAANAVDTPAKGKLVSPHIWAISGSYQEKVCPNRVFSQKDLLMYLSKQAVLGRFRNLLRLLRNLDPKFLLRSNSLWSTMSGGVAQLLSLNVRDVE